jgi:hypothetical protein
MKGPGMHQPHLTGTHSKQPPARASRPEAGTASCDLETNKSVEERRPFSDHTVGPEETSTAAEAPRKPMGSKKAFKVGEHVTFNAEGIKGAGTIDAVMPDNSALWIWADGGMGRRMLLPDSGTLVEPTGPAPEP